MQMTPVVRKLLASVLATAFAACPPAATAGYRESYHITSVEVALSPQFCWAQFEVPNVQGDEFRIRDCGVAANHYCIGLIYLIRSKRMGGKGNPLSLLQLADDNVKYTEHSIAGYPNCSIREHVQATRAEVNQLLRMYGGKPSAAK